MRRMQRQSIRKKGAMREGKSIRVATVNSSPLAASMQSPLTPQQTPRTIAQGPLTPQTQHSPHQSTFQKLFTSSPSGRERVRTTALCCERVMDQRFTDSS